MDYIKKIKPQLFHAGFKAREDIENILKKMNINFIEEIEDKIKVKRIKNKISSILKLKNNIFIQFTGPDRLFFLLNFYLKILKKKKIICLIHDLEGIRFQNKSILLKEIKLLKKVDYIISHNIKMSNILVSLGIDKEKIYEIKVFDYLLEKNILIEKKKEADICFAGNLGKSSFIYKFDKMFKNIKIDIFGINYNEDKNKNSFNYKGAFPPDVIHEKLTGKYGLIWDGESLETCTGNMGEYMKYNNPHKLSLYIAAGIPIVTWKEAAIAEFIEKNNIGITVKSLYELENYFKNLKDIDYQEQVKNTLKIRERIINGEMFKKVFEEINEKLKK